MRAIAPVFLPSLLSAIILLSCPIGIARPALFSILRCIASWSNVSELSFLCSALLCSALFCSACTFVCCVGCLSSIHPSISISSGVLHDGRRGEQGVQGDQPERGHLRGVQRHDSRGTGTPPAPPTSYFIVFLFIYFLFLFIFIHLFCVFVFFLFTLNDYVALLFFFCQ